MTQYFKKLEIAFILLYIFPLTSYAQNRTYTWEQVKRMSGVPLDSAQLKIVLAKEDSMYKAYLSKPKTLATTGMVVDWRSMMGPVANQDTDWCHGDCWAHSAAGITEAQLQISIGSRIGIFLNVTDIVQSTVGCAGSVPSVALNYIQNSKAISYVAVSPTYPNFPGIRWGILSYSKVSGIEAIESALANGPVTAAFADYQDFDDFFNNPNNKYRVYRHTTGFKNSGHAVIIVGYDHDQQYWLCKNSWGDNWADGGYFRIAYGQCGIDVNENWTVTVDQSCFAKIVPTLFSSLTAAFAYNFVFNEYACFNTPYTLSSSQVVPSGKSLQVNPGVTMSFGSGASLTVNGYLHAVGTASQPITYTSTGSTSPGAWGSLQLSGSGASGSTLTYCNIQYGTQIDVLNGANNIIIDHCNITNSSGHGINVSSSSNFFAWHNTIANGNINHGITINGGSYNTCAENTIYKYSGTPGYHNGAGILYGTSSGRVYVNDIDYYNWGIGAMYGASVNYNFYNASDPNNRVTTGIIGLKVYASSWCDLGSQDHGNGMNSIYGNSPYNVQVGNSYSDVSTLYADDNWWGNDPPDQSKFSVSPQCFFSYIAWVMSWEDKPWGGVCRPGKS
jgi:hypothetical protein